MKISQSSGSLPPYYYTIKSLFVVADAFQITLRAKMHVNDVFFIFKKLFLTSVHQNDLKRTNHIKF